MNDQNCINMKTLITRGTLIFVSWLLVAACAKETTNAPISVGEKPGMLTITEQKKLAGGTEISFKAPKDKDFLYAEAVYSTVPGKKNIVTSSRYEDRLLLTGFKDEGTYPATIYAVSKGDVRSEPLEIEIHVGKPSFREVFETLRIVDDFSGFTVVYENPSEQDIRITVLRYDPLVRRHVTEYTHFSNDVQGSFRRAGYTSPEEFRFVVTDRWENHSDTLSQTVHPLEEFVMDNSKFASHPLPPFNNLGYDSYTLFTHIWNNSIGNFYYDRTGWMSYQSGPIDFCIDIGVKAKLSRVKMNHPCSSNNVYTAFSRYTIREYELYGSNDPNPDGTWESWDRLAHFESVLPTGMSTEEIRHLGCTVGEDFFVPGEAGAYRYYRFKVLRQWGGSGFFTAIDELSFFGAELN